MDRSGVGRRAAAAEEFADLVAGHFVELLLGEATAAVERAGAGVVELAAIGAEQFASRLLLVGSTAPSTAPMARPAPSAISGELSIWPDALDPGSEKRLPVPVLVPARSPVSVALS